MQDRLMDAGKVRMRRRGSLGYDVGVAQQRSDKIEKLARAQHDQNETSETRKESGGKGGKTNSVSRGAQECEERKNKPRTLV